MSKSIRSFVVLLLILTSVAWPILPAQARPPLRFAITRQEIRNNYVMFETIVDALAITNGMTILDIGSGPGTASFLFAEKLHGSGAVFATDIREEFVNHINEEAKRRGLANLSSALVKEEGFDEFYGTHHYDLVFMSNVYHVIDNPVEYFRKLRELLNPGARVVLVLYNQAPLYSVDDLTDIEGLGNALAEGAEDNPFAQHLSAATKQLLPDKADAQVIATALVDDFNRMLQDPRLYTLFYHDSYLRMDNLSVPARDFANWLLMTLKEDGVLEKNADQIDAKAMRLVIKLNRLFLQSQFGAYLAKDGMGVYLPAGDANRHTSKYLVLRELDAAGYKIAGEITTSPYFVTVIMTPKAP